MLSHGHGDVNRYEIERGAPCASILAVVAARAAAMRCRSQVIPDIEHLLVEWQRVSREDVGRPLSFILNLYHGALGSCMMGRPSPGPSASRSGSRERVRQPQISATQLPLREADHQQEQFPCHGRLCHQAQFVCLRTVSWILGRRQQSFTELLVWR